MIKKYKLKVDPEEDCFLCSKIGISFDKESLSLILTLPLCMHHTEVIKKTVESFALKTEREPGIEG